MKKTWLIICCLYVVFTLQAVDRGLSNFYFSHITGENGLSQSNVKAIIQDSYGFMELLLCKWIVMTMWLVREIIIYLHYLKIRNANYGSGRIEEFIVIIRLWIYSPL